MTNDERETVAGPKSGPQFLGAEFAEVWTGVERIDRAHRELFEQLSTVLRSGEKQPIELLRQLQRHVMVHFREEEDEMDKLNYPDRGAHRAAHREIADLGAAFSTHIVHQGPDGDTVGSVNSALSNWLVKHIKTHDARLAAFIRERTSG